MSRRLSQAEAARELGISRRQLARHIAAGAIGLADGLVDLAAARRALKAKRKQRDEAGEAVEKDTAELRRMKIELTKAQSDWRAATGELRRLELAARKGEFVALADVRRDAVHSVTGFLAVLRTIPQRTAVILDGIAAEPDSHRRAAKIYALMTDEIERCVAEMRESKFIEIDRVGNVRAKGTTP